MTTLVAVLTVRREALEEFRAFERHAADAMKKYGGRFERNIVVDPDGSSELIKEIHVASFPDEQAFSAYRKDEQLARFAHLREQSVVQTEVYIGEDGPRYGAG